MHKILLAIIYSNGTIFTQRPLQYLYTSHYQKAGNCTYIQYNWLNRYNIYQQIIIWEFLDFFSVRMNLTTLS